MAIEQIRQIRDAEEEAEQIRKRSSTEAKQMIVDAEQKAAQLLEQARRQGEEKYKQILQEAQAEARTAYDDIIGKAKQESVHVTAAAEKNFDSAVSIIVGKVVK